MSESLSQSPSATQFAQPKPQETHDFYHALALCVAGKKITRVEWADPEIYGYVENGDLLMIQTRTDGIIGPHRWILSVGDMGATDWLVLE